MHIILFCNNPEKLLFISFFLYILFISMLQLHNGLCTSFRHAVDVYQLLLCQSLLQGSQEQQEGRKPHPGPLPFFFNLAQTTAGPSQGHSLIHAPFLLCYAQKHLYTKTHNFFFTHDFLKALSLHNS